MNIWHKLLIRSLLFKALTDTCVANTFVATKFINQNQFNKVKYLCNTEMSHLKSYKRIAKKEISRWIDHAIIIAQGYGNYESISAVVSVQQVYSTYNY